MATPEVCGQGTKMGREGANAHQRRIAPDDQSTDKYDENWKRCWRGGVILCEGSAKAKRLFSSPFSGSILARDDSASRARGNVELKS